MPLEIVSQTGLAITNEEYENQHTDGESDPNLERDARTSESDLPQPSADSGNGNHNCGARRELVRSLITSDGDMNCKLDQRPIIWSKRIDGKSLPILVPNAKSSQFSSDTSIRTYPNGLDERSCSQNLPI